MSKWIKIKLKSLETLINENVIKFEDERFGRFELEDTSIIIEEMHPNFGKEIWVEEQGWHPYMYKDEDNFYYCESWVDNKDPEINQLFDDLLGEL